MVPTTLRPLVLILSLTLLTLFRLVPTLDPISRVFIRGRVQVEPALNANDGRLTAALADNERLKNELNLAPGGQYVRADIINKTLASFRVAVRLGAGQEQGLRVNQAVLSGGYLIGLISSVEPDRATALLLGDPDVRIPVVINGAEGIVLPSAGSVIIDQVVGQVEAEHTVTTSGVEGIYQPGLLVGTVGVVLPSDIFGKFVLNRPFNLASLTFVSVRIN